VPTIYQFREFAAAGGLMSYGGSSSDQYPLLARADEVASTDRDFAPSSARRVSG
jgi:hypothetical protein